jgi:uncharacterized protein
MNYTHNLNHMNAVAYFEIQAENPEKVVDFYTQVFGWKCTRDTRIPIEYYRIETGGPIQGAILKRPAQTPPSEYGTNAFTCSMKVENFDETADKILSHGGKVALPKFAVLGTCWQGYFIDIDNNVFGLFQVDEQAK